jgi:hypothetical protein
MQFVQHKKINQYNNLINKMNFENVIISINSIDVENKVQPSFMTKILR